MNTLGLNSILLTPLWKYFRSFYVSQPIL